MPTDTDRPATSRVRRADVPNLRTWEKREREECRIREVPISRVTIPALPRPKSDGYRSDISHSLSPAGVTNPNDAGKRSTTLILIMGREKRNNYYLWAAPIPHTQCSKSHGRVGLVSPHSLEPTAESRPKRLARPLASSLFWLPLLWP